MIAELKKQLAHILWIGGATDTGKSTIAQNLAARQEMYIYHYDRTDEEHHTKLAKTVPEIQKFIEASLDERWVVPEPRALFERSLFSFHQRFSLVIEDLIALPNDKPIIAEGFGLLPELVHPILSSYYQAVWLVPTESFKRNSMERRGKPSFGKLTSNPERAKANLLTRDLMLADYYRKQVSSYGYTLHEVDGSRTAEQMTDLVEAHLAEYLQTLER
jgi:2-phosphoglycerate kinase